MKIIVFKGKEGKEVCSFLKSQGSVTESRVRGTQKMSSSFNSATKESLFIENTEYVSLGESECDSL